MPQYRKKPVLIEARQLTDNKAESMSIIKWMFDYNCHAIYHGETGYITIPTLEGNHLAKIGDYIIRGVVDEFYPCKQSIFENTYEEI